MTTKRILAAVVTAMVCVTCCAKEDFKDPQKFAEKYVRADIVRARGSRILLAPYLVLRLVERAASPFVKGT